MTKTPPVIKELFLCECRSSNHILVAHYEPYDDIHPDVLSLYVTLTTGNLWHRIKTAMKYIFKGNEGYPFDDVLFDINSASKLKGVLKEYIDWENEKGNQRALNRIEEIRNRKDEYGMPSTDPFGPPQGKEII